jgi:probable F420-dependent oxidoreductase
MRIGVVLPTCDIGTDPAAIRDFAQTAEGLGYDHIVIYDHVLGAVHAGREPKLLGPYDENDAFHEPFVLFAWLAGQTRRIELATGVLVLPQRQTALVAKQAAELALLSGGRLRLGVGTGWNWVEYESLGVPFGDRGRRLDEQIELLRRLWQEPLLDFRGKFHRVERAGLLPRPAQPIPIWLGGYTEVAIRRAARVGDGFLFGSAAPPMQGLARRLLELVEAAGRPRASCGVETIVPWGAGPDGWTKSIEQWRALGATHVSLRTLDRGMEVLGEPVAGFRSPRQHIDALEPFMRAVR